MASLGQYGLTSFTVHDTLFVNNMKSPFCKHCCLAKMYRNLNYKSKSLHSLHATHRELNRCEMW